MSLIDAVQTCEGDDDPCFQEFRREMQLKDEAKRRIADEKLALKKLERFSKQKEWLQQVKRTHQYLGLHAAPTSSKGPADALSYGLQDLTLSPEPLKKTPDLSSRNELQSVSCDPVSSAIFVSIDVEAYEFNQKLVTEIGISKLDTRDLIGLPSGMRGINWATKIQSRHLRIHENRNCRNKVHVEGCPDEFDFGRSEWIYKRGVLSALEESLMPSPSLLSLASSGSSKVVLVGHDLKGDIKYLEALGVDVTRMVSDCIDTSHLYKATHRDARQSALNSLLLEYRIAAKHLHNAGNDANYTLRVMLAIVLENFLNQKSEEDWEVEKQSRIEAACREASARVCAELEGWDTSGDERSTESAVSELDHRREMNVPGNGATEHRSGLKPIQAQAAVSGKQQSARVIRNDCIAKPAAVQSISPRKNLNLADSSLSSGRSVSRDQQFSGVDMVHHDRGRGQGQARSRGRGRGRVRAGGEGRGRDRA